MSRSIDLFVATDHSLAEVARAVASLPDVEAVESGDAYLVATDAVHAELKVHAYIDDADLPLASYPVALSASVPNGTRLGDAPETAFLRTVADGLQALGHRTLLVHDLQYRDADHRSGHHSAEPQPGAASEVADSPDAVAGDGANGAVHGTWAGAAE